MSEGFAQWGKPGSAQLQEAEHRGEVTQRMLHKLREKAAARKVAEEDDPTTAARRERIDALKAQRRGSESQVGDDLLARFRAQQREKPKSVSSETISIYLTERDYQGDLRYEFCSGSCVAKIWPRARPDKVTTLKASAPAELFGAIKAHIEQLNDASGRSRSGNREKKRGRRR